VIPLKESIIIVKVGKLDDWGRPTKLTELIVRGRVDYQSKRVMNDQGVETISKAVILLKGIVDVSTSDSIKWVDVYGEHIAKPISVSPLKDLSSKIVFTKVVI